MRARPGSAADPHAAHLQTAPEWRRRGPMMVAMARHDRALLPLAILAPLVAADCGHRPRAVATVGRSDDVISVGRRTLAVETEAVLAEDGKLHEESVLRLGGDLAVAATAAIGVGGK